MKNGQQPETRRLYKMPFLHSICVVIYVSLVALIMQNGNKLFGKEDTVLTVIGVLLLFSVSAAIVGSLIFARPIIMVLAGDRKGAVRFAVTTIGFLVLEAILFFIAMAIWQ